MFERDFKECFGIGLRFIYPYTGEFICLLKYDHHKWDIEMFERDFKECFRIGLRFIYSCMEEFICRLEYDHLKKGLQ